MDEVMRYRVTGAIFLLALAVIVLPMLFDGDGVPRVQVEPIEKHVEVPVVAPFEEVAADDDYRRKASELAATVDADGFVVEHGTRIGEPVLRAEETGTKVWAVQTGSFADRDNAVQFRDQLRTDGYEAFLSTVKTSAGVMHRVAIGPLLNRDEADDLRQQLTAQYDAEARLMAFSSS